MALRRPLRSTVTCTALKLLTSLKVMRRIAVEWIRQAADDDVTVRGVAKIAIDGRSDVADGIAGRISGRRIPRVGDDMILGRIAFEGIRIDQLPGRRQ